MDTNHLNELLILLQEGRTEYFDEFYELTKRGVYSSAYAILQNPDEAENILQDTYLKFLEKLPKLKADRSVLAYLMKTATNLAINTKKQYRHLAYNVDVSEVADDESPRSEDHHVFDVMKEVLNETEIRIVILHSIEELSHQEIASLLHKPLGTVTWTYNNAIQKMRKALEKDGYR